MDLKVEEVIHCWGHSKGEHVIEIKPITDKLVELGKKHKTNKPAVLFKKMQKESFQDIIDLISKSVDDRKIKKDGIDKKMGICSGKLNKYGVNFF